MKKKKIWKIIVLILILLIVIGGILLYIFDISKIAIISFNTDGGSMVEKIKTKKGKTVKLPNAPTKKDYIFVGWEDKNNNIVNNEIIVNENTNIKSLWISKDAKTVTISFDTDGGNKIENIKIEKYNEIKLPVNPTKGNNVFAGWIDEKGNIIQKGMIINSDIKLKALWIEKSKEIVTISFDTDGGNKIENIKIEKDKTPILPPNPIKKEYSFTEWVNEKEEKITKETIISKDTKLKAIWTGPYVCPENCLQNDDGKYCTKTKYPVISYKCPGGYTLLEGQCLKTSTKYTISENPNEKNIKCKNDKEGKYTEKLNGKSVIYCAEKTDVITNSSCQIGYTLDNDICKMNEVTNCMLSDKK